jgi:alcohol dehydrogenase (NADP+)
MISTKAYAAQSPTSPLAPCQIQRRGPGAHEVLLDIAYCGICHSDIHIARGELPGVPFPVVPGHEIIGKVVSAGTAVTKHKVGDVVGIGLLIGSCRNCRECDSGQEQFCDRATMSVMGVEEDGATPIYGGYSTQYVVHEDFALRIPPALAPAEAAPLLCAGITTYSALRHWRAGKGSKVGIVGLGGVGHLGVKFAAAMGAEVTVLSRSSNKEVEARAQGASRFADTTDHDTFTTLAGEFDLILSTVSGGIDYDAYLSLLNRDGTLGLLGFSDKPVSLNAFGLIMKRRSLGAAQVGGIGETQEMLDFCAATGIGADIELIDIESVNEAYERILKSDVRYRFVIDMASLR